MPLQDITNAKHLPVRGAASKLFASPQGKSKSTKAASPPSPAQLAAAYAVFTQQKANLLARTQHADVVIATALRQLERHTAGCTPPRPGAHQSSSSKADPPNTISAEKFHIVDRLHARSGSLLDVDALRRRNDELARKLHDAVDAAHRLQEKLSTHLGDVHGLRLEHADEGASLEQAQEPSNQETAEPAATAAITSPQHAPRAAVKEGSTTNAAAGGNSPHTARLPAQQLLLAGLQPIAVAGPRRAAAAGGRLVLSARACPQEQQEQQQQQQQRFSMSVDWSAMPLPAAERGQSFRPGTSVHDFCCHQDEVAAYLTTQQGLRDGKRRRLASGMLAQCLSNKQPAPPAQGASTVGQESGADAVPSLQHTPGRARRTGLRREGSSANVVAAATAAAAAAGGEQGAAVEAASPATALPSRTPKRKRGERCGASGGERSISEAEAASAQAELEAAFSLLTTAEQPAVDVVVPPVCDSPGTVTAVQMQALPYFHAATGLVVPVVSSASQQEEEKGKAAEAKEEEGGLEAEQQEFETLKLFDDLWLGGAGGNSKAASNSKGKEVLPPSKGSSMGNRAASRRAPAGICAIS